jgi:hypothetical protein
MNTLPLRRADLAAGQCACLEDALKAYFGLVVRLFRNPLRLGNIPICLFWLTQCSPHCSADCEICTPVWFCVFPKYN